MTVIRCSLLFVCLLVSAPLASGQQTDLQSQLTRAEATWRKQELRRYEFTVRVWCFCGFIGDPMRFRVEDGKSTPIDVHPDSVPLARKKGVMSIEDLFSMLHRVARGNPDVFIVDFDSERGFPTDVEIDVKRSWTDDELKIRVTDLVVLGQAKSMTDALRRATIGSPKPLENRLVTNRGSRRGVEPVSQSNQL